VTAVENDVRLGCQAYSEEILDVAYVWMHNGLRIRDTDPIHTRVVSFCHFPNFYNTFFVVYLYSSLGYTQLSEIVGFICLDHRGRVSVLLHMQLWIKCTT
jgi:hypothetical protein